ncbi:MAG: DNA polymerase III subunit alpha, partial [Alloprevotella sp.]|nr:DNA polymerase III subunit alpha [Alloprevotella sp.]
GITQIDPIEYDLLFERFLNPDRISLPDIDVDFDDDGRGKVLEWVTKKYGEENCAHIITYGTMATKLAVRDVARVEKVPLAESNRLCKLIPDRLPEDKNGETPKMNLTNVLAAIPELREAAASNDTRVRDTFRYAKMLEGNVRNTGVHACGFIICKDKISDWVPVSTADDKETGKKLHCTQYEGKVIEETGLIKMDFLGLKNLSIIKEALENIEQSLGIRLDIDSIPLDDAPTYQLFSDGNTIGTFQFESAGMQKYLRELRPTVLGDLIAMNALYRPGPMQYIPQFIKRKNGEEEITYPLPCMEKYLKDTYGITVYQEQVMLLSREIADFTRGESDALRKAMGKKKKDIVDNMRPKFIKGGKAKGYDEAILAKIWSDWERFASYAFNKSHAACYAWIAYQTGYLKANYPSQYMAGAMSRNLANITEITKLMDECKAMGIKTLGPDINESRIKFSVNHEGDIRFGLGGIKGVGTGAVLAVLEERDANGPFSSIYDLVERINLNTCNKKNLENMAMAGVFDSLNVPREAFFAQNERGETFLDVLTRYGNLFQTEKNTASNSLFGDFNAVEISKPEPPEYTSWTDLEKLNRERELIGIYLSAHPLDQFRVILDKVCNTATTELSDLAGLTNREVVLGGIVSSVREGQTRKGKPYGITRIEDYNGSGELALFGEDWARQRNYLIPGHNVLIRGKVDVRMPRRDAAEEGKPATPFYSFHIEQVQFLAEAKEQLIKSVTIEMNLEDITEERAAEMAKYLMEEKKTGTVTLHFRIVDNQERWRVTLLSKTFRISIDGPFLRYITGDLELDYSIN